MPSGSNIKVFNKLLDRATSQLLMEADWDSILQLCDVIRQGEVTGKQALESVRKKITGDNPHVCRFAFDCLEAMVKNCGSKIHQEVASRDFMEFMHEQASKRNDPLKSKILELLQCWAHGFRKEPKYKIVEDTVNAMKMEGFHFPPMSVSDAMFDADVAPEWQEGNNCYRCRVPFSMIMRRHHCRNCGQIFCAKCSGKNAPIPKFGFEKEVRVCETCYDKLAPADQQGDLLPPGVDGVLPPEYLSSPLAREAQGPRPKSEAEMEEEEQLQLALAISQSEAENKEQERLKRLYTYNGSTPAQSTTNSNSQPIYAVPTPAPAPAQSSTVRPTTLDTTDMDPELANYLDRNYWQAKHETRKGAIRNSPPPSAPQVHEASLSEPPTNGPARIDERYQNGAVVNEEQQQFLLALNKSIEIFVNRMKSDSQRGRIITNDTAVQSLFLTLQQMHPQLLTHTKKLEDDRAYYESLQDKLTQLKDAREALNALREENAEKRHREAEERERLRQAQLLQKLHFMRQKKEEYLEYQRQLHLRQMQEQERLLAERQEQMKQMTQYRQMQYQQPSLAPVQGYGVPPQGAPVNYQMAPGQPYVDPMAYGGMAPQMGPNPAAGPSVNPSYYQQQPQQQQPPYNPTQQQQPHVYNPQQQQWAPPMGPPVSAPSVTAPYSAPPQQAPYNMYAMANSLPNMPPQQQQPPQHHPMGYNQPPMYHPQQQAGPPIEEPLISFD